MFLSKLPLMSELKIYQILEMKGYKNYKSGGQMFSMDIILEFTRVEAQKVQ